MISLSKRKIPKNLPKKKLDIFSNFSQVSRYKSNIKKQFIVFLDTSKGQLEIDII